MRKIIIKKSEINEALDFKINKQINIPEVKRSIASLNILDLKSVTE